MIRRSARSHRPADSKASRPRGSGGFRRTFASDEYAASGGGEGERANLAVTELLARRSRERPTNCGARRLSWPSAPPTCSGFRRSTQLPRGSTATARPCASGVGEASAELLPVLDDIGRAREHGELTGGFKRWARRLETIVAKLGLEQFGEEGDPFDPNVHEALMHTVLGGRHRADSGGHPATRLPVGDRVLRPARVAVAEPAEPSEPGDTAETDEKPPKRPKTE